MKFGEFTFKNKKKMRNIYLKLEMGVSSGKVIAITSEKTVCDVTKC